MLHGVICRLVEGGASGERAANGLKEGDVVANVEGVLAGDGEGEGFGEVGDELEEAFFAVLLGEDVLEGVGEDGEARLGVAGFVGEWTPPQPSP